VEAAATLICGTRALSARAGRSIPAEGRRIRPAPSRCRCNQHRLVLRARRKTPSKDYTDEIIGSVERSFRTIAVISSSADAGCSSPSWVAWAVRSAPPTFEPVGIGKMLMADIGRVAEGNIHVMTVQFSIAAEGFDARLGSKSAHRQAFRDGIACRRAGRQESATTPPVWIG